jgi:hypothetical protein
MPNEAYLKHAKLVSDLNRSESMRLLSELLGIGADSPKLVAFVDSIVSLAILQFAILQSEAESDAR